jgi:bifunctional DNA-binding transcriptional regulator/antitoxin component of YhaV-PrlF toxin-antitoxin module
MTRPKDRAKFEKLDNTIWQKSKVDKKGRTVLPQKLRRKLGLNEHSSILWISVHHGKQDNIFNIEVGVKK